MKQNYGQLIAEGLIHDLNAIVTTFGRHPNNLVQFQHPSISKFHSIIEFDDQANALIVDKGSTNGTYVNGKQISKNEPTSIYSGDVIKFGTRPVDYKFLNFSYPSDNANQLGGNQGNLDNTVDEAIGGGEFTLGKDYPKSGYEQSKFSAKMEGSTVQNFQNFEQKAQNLIGSLNQHLHPSILSNDMENNMNKSKVNNQLIGSLNSMISEMTKEISLLREKVQKQQEIITEEDTKMKEITQEMTGLEDKKKLGHNKQEALEKYIIELQRQFTDLERANVNQQDKIDELCDKNWAKNMENLKMEQAQLNRIHIEKQDELSNIQKYATSLLSSNSGEPNVEILEGQSKQLSLVKRKLIEFENRNNDCSRKWKDLYDENIRKDEHIKGLRLQLDRQSELHQQLYTEFDRKYYESQSTVAYILKKNVEPQVALELSSQFIVDIVRTVTEEKEDFSQDNNELRANYNDLQAEVEKLEGQKDYFNSVFLQTSDSLNGTQALISLKTRVYELLDLGEEIKHYNTQQEVQDLEKLIVFLESRLQNSRHRNNTVEDKIGSIQKFRDTQNDENTVEFFAKLLDEKDKKIAQLTKELEQESLEVQQGADNLSKVKSRLDGLTGMCYDISDAQKAISSIAFTKQTQMKENDIFFRNETVTSNNVFADQHRMNENPALVRVDN